MLKIVLFITVYSLWGSHIKGAPNKEYFDVESVSINDYYNYLADYNKDYEAEEKVRRFDIFLNNLRQINKLNEEHPATTFGLTRFTDITEEEFMQLHNCVFNNNNETDFFDIEVTVPIPDELDWRDKGVVTEAKAQLNCGSCWAFSTTGEIEGQYAIKNKKLISLSEQELVDCSRSNGGCFGGQPHKAMQDIKEIGGFMAEKAYPYKSIQGQCMFKRDQVVVNIIDSGPVFVDENTIAGFLSQHGPLSISMELSPQLHHYTKDIMTPTDCTGHPNHAVLLVGYGKDYWLIKNSYGPTWGDAGYFRLARGKNLCSFGTYAAASRV